MSIQKNIILPPLNQTGERGSMNSRVQQNESELKVQTSEEIHDSADDFYVERQSTTKLCWSGCSYLYAGPGRKPELLRQLEHHVNEELCAISSQEPKFEELKLQVYRNVFDQFISAFTTYQPLLCIIKKEYDNIIADQQDQIKKLAPLQSQLRLVTEECERKIRAEWKEQHTEIETLKREKQQLQNDVQSMKEKERNMQTVVDHLQSELSQQYLQYRDEHDARQLLIRQFNDITTASVMSKPPAVQGKGMAVAYSVYETLSLTVDRKKKRSFLQRGAEVYDRRSSSVHQWSHAEDDDEEDYFQELQLEVEACREELSRMKAEYRDAVSQHDWDALQQTHQQTVQQLKTLKGDFKLMKSEYDTLLELHKTGTLQPKNQVSTSVQTEESVDEKPETKPDQLDKLINLHDHKKEHEFK